MNGTPLAGTDLSREILGEVLDERGKPGLDPQQQRAAALPCRPPATTLAEKVQSAIDLGESLDELRRLFQLSESELRDYCSDIMDDGGDEDWSESVSGY